MTIAQKNVQIGHFLNGTLTSLQSVVPISFTIGKPELLKETLHITYGVLIGFAGDIRGKLALKGEPNTFRTIGEKMFGMPIDETMLPSFTGEFGNLVTGGLSTQMSKKGTNIDITPPTVMDGEVALSGFENALHVAISFDEVGDIDIFMMIDR